MNATSALQHTKSKNFSDLFAYDPGTGIYIFLVVQIFLFLFIMTLGK